MSGLAHFFESEGLASVVVALVREHAERMRAPRALWVPFELGRPMGPPADAPFQRRVMQAALALLASAGAPGTIQDFAADSPGERADPAWRAPSLGGAGDLAGEVAALMPAWDRLRERSGRTTVGLSELEMPAAAHLVAAWAAGECPPDPRRRFAPIQTLRFAVDDLKAFYLEAACEGGGYPTSHQLERWFWLRTGAARAILAVRERCLASRDENERAIGGRMLVPHRARAWLAEAGA